MWSLLSWNLFKIFLDELRIVRLSPIFFQIWRNMEVLWMTARSRREPYPCLGLYIFQIILFNSNFLDPWICAAFQRHWIIFLECGIPENGVACVRWVSCSQNWTVRVAIQLTTLCKSGWGLMRPRGVSYLGRSSHASQPIQCIKPHPSSGWSSGHTA